MVLINNKIQFKLRNSIGEKHFTCSFTTPSPFKQMQQPSFSILANPIMMGEIDAWLLIRLRDNPLIDYIQIREEYKKLY